MHRFTLFALVTLTACHVPPPECRYPCHPETVAVDCPAAWWCRVDHTCWITPDPIDAAMIPDAGSATDAGHDATDTGPHYVAETCNGTDDDCDGLVDEGVITVGPAVTATSADFIGGTIVGLSTGFGVLAPSRTMPSVPTWFPIDSAGVTSASPPLGADLTMDAPWSLLGADAEGRILVATYDGTANTRYLVGFDPTSGARRVGTAPFPIPLPAGESPGSGAFFVGASAGRVTLYMSHGGVAPNGLIRRYRLDVATGTPSVIDARDIVTDLSDATGWAVLGTPDADYVVYYRADSTIALVAGPAGDAAGAFHLVGVIGSASTARMDYASLAIRDPSAPVSVTNPLGVAWAGRAGVGGRPATVAFAEVRNTTVFAASMPVSFPDALGAWGGFFVTHPIELRALTDAPEHWILVSQDSNATPPTSGVVQVREILGAGSTVRRLSVPGETAAPRGDVGLAQSGAALRLVERANGMGLVTRSIGCE